MPKAKISQESFRALFRCTEFQAFGGVIPLNLSLEVVSNTFERLTVLYLRENLTRLNDDIYINLVSCLNRIVKREELLSSQINKLLNISLILTNDLIKTFNISCYYPIFGPFILNYRISKTVIELRISGVFRHKNQSLHIVLFSPYSRRLDIINDPCLILICKSLEPFVKEHFSGRPKVILHIFYYEKEESIGYETISSNSFVKKKIPYIKNIVKNYECKIAYPVIPCRYNCMYKNKCGSDNERFFNYQ